MLALMPAPAPAAAHPQTELDQITARGKALYEYDSAAWHATDAVQKIAGNNTAGLGMFIARQIVGTWVVDFGKLRADASAFDIKYRAVQVSGDRYDVQTYAVPLADSKFDLFAARAIDASRQDFGQTRRVYNYAVLPASESDFFIYLYPAQTDPKIYPIGGDMRYRFNNDGTHILEKHQMHRAILDMTTDSQPGKTMVAGFHTDIFDEVPEDTDVFHVLTRQPPMPDFVAAKGELFEIAPDGTITDKGATRQ